jgi:hypothetical protein
MKINKRIFDDTSYMDYLYIKNEKYPYGLIVDKGAYVDISKREQGKLKALFAKLFSKYDNGTILQYAVKNKDLLSMFKRMNFYRVNSIEYWGQLSDSILIEGKIYQGIIEDMYNK